MNIYIYTYSERFFLVCMCVCVCFIFLFNNFSLFSILFHLLFIFYLVYLYRATTYIITYYILEICQYVLYSICIIFVCDSNSDLLVQAKHAASIALRN